MVECAASQMTFEKLRLVGRRVTYDLCGEVHGLELITLSYMRVLTIHFHSAVGNLPDWLLVSLFNLKSFFLRI